VNNLLVISSREETAGRVSVIEADRSRGTSRHTRLNLQKIVEVKRVARLECFIGDRENFEVDNLINFEPI